MCTYMLNRDGESRIRAIESLNHGKLFFGPWLVPKRSWTNFLSLSKFRKTNYENWTERVNRTRTVVKTFLRIQKIVRGVESKISSIFIYLWRTVGQILRDSQFFLYILRFQIFIVTQKYRFQPIPILRDLNMYYVSL